MIDYRIANPGYHRLLVIYAQEALKTINNAIDSFSSISRINMTICAGKLIEEKQDLIRTNVAFQEAVWRIEANDLLIAENKE